MPRQIIVALAAAGLLMALIAGPVAAKSAPKPPPLPAPAVTVSSTVSGTSATLSASVNRILLLVKSCTYTVDGGTAKSCGKPTSLKLTSTGWTIKLTGLTSGGHTVTVIVKLRVGGSAVRSTVITIGPPAHKVFAVAFTDNDGDHAFNPSIDVLIAKLEDTNDDLTVDTGDTILMGRYPTIFAAHAPGDFADFTVTSHTVDVVGSVSSNEIIVSSNGHPFDWYATSAGETYTETIGSVASTTLQDWNGAQLSEDTIQTDPGSPSAPVTTTDLHQVIQPDDTFIDVIITP